MVLQSPCAVHRVKAGRAAIRVIAVNAVGMETTDPGARRDIRPDLGRPQRPRSGGVRGSMAARAPVVLLALMSGGLALVFGAPVASASPLVWDAPSGCPDAADVRTRIERRLGASIDHTVHGIEITVTRERGGYIALIDARALTVANDVRTLRSARCDELADAVAVIVARLATEARDRAPDTATLGPDGTHLTALPDSRRSGARAPDTGHPDAQVAARDGADEELALVNRRPVELPVQRNTWGGGMHLHGLSGAGALPELNLGAELGGHVRRLDRFVELAVGLWVPQSAHLQAGAPARVDVSLQVVTLRGGWSPRDLPLRAWLTAEVGRIQGIGVAVDDPRSASSRWTALGGGFNVAWPMSPLARLVGSVEMVIPLERTIFMLDDGRDLYQPSIAAARCSFGIELGWK